MYILLEHHKGPAGEVLATDMLLTSKYPGKPFINFKSATENALFTLLVGKSGLFKEPHPKDRSYNETTFVWSFLGTVGKTVYEAIKDSPLAKIGIRFERVKNLTDQAESKYFTAPSIAEPFDPNNFFHDPTPSAPSDEDKRLLLIAELAALLGLPSADLIARKDEPIIKKQYRVFALANHPDRPGGSAERMSHLNYMWQALHQEGSWKIGA